MNARTGKLIWKTPAGEHSNSDSYPLKAMEHKLTLKAPYTILPGSLGGVPSNLALAETSPGRQGPRPEAPALRCVCHSNATHPKEVLGSTFEKCSQPGAPLRNRTVDLLLTMDHQTVPVSAAEALSRQNTSSR